MTTVSLINAVADVEDWLADLDRKVTVGDLADQANLGLSLTVAAGHYIDKKYVDDGIVNTFMESLRAKAAQGTTITSSQMAVALDIWRENLTGKRYDSDGKMVSHQCWNCDKPFLTWDALREHKAQEHGGERPVNKITDNAEATAVIADTTSSLGLDLSGLPDSNYAAPDPTGTQNNMFLRVRRLRRPSNRDRRYMYGKIVTGDEVAPAGTIEVRVQRGDTKELVGEQRPGDVYRGQFENELQLVMLAPETFAKLFGRLTERCGRCGKTLTDDVSKAIGLGLECEKKENYWKAKPPSYAVTCPHIVGGRPCGFLGRVRQFFGTGKDDRATRYKCASGHEWLADRDGNPTHFIDEDNVAQRLK